MVNKLKPSKVTKNRKSVPNKDKIKSFKGRTSRRRSGRKTLRKQPRQPKGVVYLSHIPHGFYEEQIEAYFSQFGNVTAVSVPRSKTGRAKGYAFIEFKHPEVAEIASDTMNNYLMFNRLLKAKYIAPENQKPHLFLKAAREDHKTAAEKAELAVKHHRKVKNRHLKMSLETKYAKKLLKKKRALMKRAEKLGLSCDFAVGEENLQLVFERKKELQAKKEKEETPTTEEEDTETSEDLLSSADDEDLQSFEDIDVLSEDEDDGKIITKAKKGAKDILKNNPKPSKLKLKKENNAALNILSAPPSKKQNKLRKLKLLKKDIPEKENTPLTKELKSSKLTTGIKELDTSMLTLEDDIKIIIKEKENSTPQRTLKRKSLGKKEGTPFAEKALSPSKRRKPPTLRHEKSNTPQVVMEVDQNDEEINFKTPPNVSKKFINNEQRSAKKTPNVLKKNIQNQPSPSLKKRNSGNVSPLKGQSKTPKKSSPRTPLESQSGKKIRHRNLKKNLDTL